MSSLFKLLVHLVEDDVTDEAERFVDVDDMERFVSYREGSLEIFTS